LMKTLVEHDMNIPSSLYFKMCDELVAMGYDTNEVTSSMLAFTNRGVIPEDNHKEEAIKYLYRLIPEFPKVASELRDYKFKLYEPLIFEAYNLRKQELNNNIKEINNAINNSVGSVQQTELFS